jgi:hypothetical protein
MNVIDRLRFLTEPSGSEDFGKSPDEWQASKAGKPAEWRVRMLAPVAAAVVLMVLVVALLVGLTGCSGVCGDHGGIRSYAGNNVYICNDGTRV